MFELKPLSREGIGHALEKVERYRLLNEPWEAESICRDVLSVDPGNQVALVALLLSLTDQFTGLGGPPVEEVQALLTDLGDDYKRAYYAGIICERKGAAILQREAPGTGPIVYRWLTEAMAHYEAAEAIRPLGDDDAILRWNTCARLIMLRRQLRPAPDIRHQVMLE